MKNKVADVVKVLVIAPNWIGDAIMAQPLLREILRDLSRHTPHAEITALAPPHVAPVLHYMPEVKTVIAAPFAHGRLQLRERLRLARQLRGFDVAYVLPNSWKSALLPWLARIPQRVGYTGEMRFGLLNQRLPNPAKHAPRPPMAAFYAALAGAGANNAAGEDSTPARPTPDYLNVDRPRLTLNEAQRTSVRQKFLAHGDFFIGFCPGAEYGPAKRYPAEQFAQLAQLIHQRWPNARVLCLGGPKDYEIAEQIRQITSALAPDLVQNLCGKTNLHEAIALIGAMQAIVTNDSGLMHIAAALDVPLVALYGSTDPHHTPPHSPRASVARIEIDCSPCFKRECPLGHFRCMRDLSAEQVFSALQIQLALFNHPAFALPPQGAHPHGQ